MTDINIDFQSKKSYVTLTYKIINNNLGILLIFASMFLIFPVQQVQKCKTIIYCIAFFLVALSNLRKVS